MMDLQFYKMEDEDKLRFYQMPKILFTNEGYRGLSLGAKAMYSILRDRQDLSIKNKWVDGEGHIYLVFTIENLSRLLDISSKTAIKYKKELAQYKLLFEKRLGQGKPNRLYVLKPDYSQEDTYKREGDPFGPRTYPQGPGLEEPMTGNYSPSRWEEASPLDLNKLAANDTESSENDFRDTQSFLGEEREGLNERNPQELERILDQACIDDPYFEHSYLPLKRAIESLYYREDNLNINGMSLPPAKIREDLAHLDYCHLMTGLQIFKEQSQEQRISNRISYLATCIYTSIFDMHLKIQHDLLYEGIIH